MSARLAGFLQQWLSNQPPITVLHWIITFLILALIAGLLGFTGLAGASVDIAQILFYVFLVLLVISFLARALKGKAP